MAESSNVKFGTLSPYLVVENGQAQIDFLEKAFGAKVTHGPKKAPDSDRLGHTEMMIGDNKIMLGEPPSGEPIPSMLFIEVDDCDAAYQQLLDAGAESVMPPMDMEDCRQAGVKDCNGNQWWVGK